MYNEQDMISEKLNMARRVGSDFPFLKEHFEVQPTYQLTSQGQQFGGFNIRIFTDIGDNRIYLDVILEEELKKIAEKKYLEKLKKAANMVKKEDKKLKKVLQDLIE